MSYTYALMGVSPRAYAEIAARLKAAGYEQAFHESADGVVLDMHGIALQRGDGTADAIEVDADCKIEIGSLLASRTKTGAVELSLNNETIQMDLNKAREVLRMLSTAIEAAISDELMYRFLTKKCGLSNESASAALLDFRELRQGSKSVVHPH